MKPGAGQGSPLRYRRYCGQQLHLSGAPCFLTSRASHHGQCLLAGPVDAMAWMVDPTLTLSRQREEVAPRPIVKKRQAVAGSGWEAAAVVGRFDVVLQLQFIDKVVFVLLQLKFQQSRVCTGSSSTECWTFQLCSERSTHSANCAEGCSCVDVPVIGSDKFPQSRGSNPLAPDSLHPLSGEHSCCVEGINPAPHIHEQMATTNYVQMATTLRTPLRITTSRLSTMR